MDRVAFIGGGIGGLTLAQILLAAGIDVGLYERDPSPGTVTRDTPSTSARSASRR